MIQVSGDPPIGAQAITPDDNNDLPHGYCRSIYVGVTGDIAVDMANGDTVTFTHVAVGILRLSAKRVYATGTTATGLVALY